MVKNKTQAVAIHGCVGYDSIVYMGGTGEGVQLELTSGLRKLCFKNQKYNKHSREDQSNWSQFMDNFTIAIVQAIQKVQ